MVLIPLILAAAAAASATPIDLSSPLEEGKLAQVIWERGPDLVDARTKLGADAADVLRARLLPNPQLDVSVGTIPIGPRNPTENSPSFWDVPNYNAGVSELLEIGKRGPRQQAAVSAHEATVLETRELLRQRVFDLLGVISDIAVSQGRLAALEQLANDAAELTRVETGRASKGESAGLDVDRARLEEERYRTDLAEEQEKLARTLQSCVRIAGVPCLPFKSGDQAIGFLQQRAVLPAQAENDARPDVKALEARQASAQASLDLANAKVIPDPTVHLGYTNDRFIVSGNQANSLNVGVSLPLTFFDRGQGDALQASTAAAAAALGRDLLVERNRSDVTRLSEQFRVLSERRERLQKTTVPLARQVVTQLSAAVERGGATLPDLLLARRTLGELLMSSVDMDGAALQLALSVQRAAGQEPTPPSDLSSH